MARRCIPVDLPGGGHALVTVDVSPRRPCWFCGTLTHALCDFPLPAASAIAKRKIRTCDKRICERCAQELAEDVHLCPVHAQFAREHGLETELGELLSQRKGYGKNKGENGTPVALDLVLQRASRAGDALPIAHKTTMSRRDWVDTFKERAAVLEYEGGLAREQANKIAHGEIASVYGAMPVAQ